MKKLSKNWKKAVAVVLSLAMTAGCLPTVGNYVKAAEQSSVNFDDKNIVLRMGVMSDLHLAYGYTSKEGIKDNVKSYAKAVGTLNAMAGNELDVLMLAGDYTGYGCEIQGKTFASASKAILDQINTGKSDADKTQFFMTYGNHDTEWQGQMSYAEWESMLNSYNLLDGVTMGPDNSGCYKYTKKVDGKTYYFYSLETERYYADGVTNTFRTDVLEWLDTELAKTPKDAYAYVVSHGPISESGVYGADIDFERNANWGTSKDGFTGTVERDGQTYTTSSDLNGILEKYPQVLYLSGHTHMTNVLESTIMSDAYTAITVAQFKAAEFYSSKTNYLDEAKNATRPGYSLYIEVDKDGNQRITRVDTESSTVIGDVTITGTEDTADNPTTGEDLKKFPTIYGYYTASVSMTKNEGGKVEKLPAWTMMAPNSEGTHLATYSASARKETPVFNSGELKLNEVQNDKGKSVTVNFTFPTAKCTNSKVIRYEFTLYDETGRTLDTQWIIGNWINNTDGVTEDEKTHIDATTLTYSKKYENGELTGATGIYATLTAVNEFGGTATLTAGSKDETTSIGILKPTASGANKNMFDGVNSDRNFVASHQDTVSTSFDEKGVATVHSKLVGTTDPWTSVRFALSEQKYNGAVAENKVQTYYKNWNAPGCFSEQYTDLAYTDTFVYEADFSAEATTTGYVEFQIRTADVNDNSKDWMTDYNGIRVARDGVSLLADNQVVGTTSNAFMLPVDNTTHHITVVSAPETISVWIDDTLVFDSVSYVPTKTDRMKTTNMLPTMALFINGFDGKITNQNMYLYDKVAQVADDWKATESELFAANKIHTEGSILYSGEEASKNPVIGSNSVKVCAKYNAESIYNTGAFTLDLSEAKLTKDDTVITEFDYKPSGLDCGSDNSSVLHDIEIDYRQKGDNTLKFLLRVGAVYSDIGSGYVHIPGNSGLSEGKTSHCKIVSEPTKVSVYIDGKLVVQSDYAIQETVPFVKIVIRNGNYEFTNFSVRKADGSFTYENVTKATDDNNLLNGVYGKITSSFTGNKDWEGKSDSVVLGNNFYTDMTWMNLQSHGVVDAYYMGELFYPFGATNSNMIFKGNESFVVSALISVKNKSLKQEGMKEPYPSRVGMQVADYGEKSLWYFIQDETLNVYQTVNGSDSNELLKVLNLSTLIGYQVGDYIRMTTTMSPYGFDIYINGTQMYTYTIGDGTNVNFKKMAWTAYGAEIRFLDASVHYNYDNEALYKERLLEYTDSTKGVYFENADSINAKTTAIKEACSKATSSETLWKYVGTVEKEIEKSGKVVNNLVQEKKTAISHTAVNESTAQYAFKEVELFKAGECPFTTEDTWVIEANIKTVGFVNNVPRIAIKLGENARYYMFQSNMVYLETPGVNGGWTAQSSPALSSNLYNNGNGTTWHVRYEIVKNEKMNVTITSGDGSQTYFTGSCEFSALGVTEFAPRFAYANTDVIFNVTYVGYDLAENVKAFDEAVTTGESKDLSSYAWESVELYKDALAQAKTMNEEVKAYVGDATANIYTTPYSKKELETEVVYLQGKESSLKAATAFATVGTDGTGSGKINVGIADDKKLPVKEYVSDKYYIIGWTCEGESVTEVTDTTDMSKYVPEYVDLDMLQVKKQAKSNDKNSSRIDIRFIASVDKLDYEKAGLVFSVYDANPTIDKTDCFSKNKSKVYSSLYAEGDPKTAEAVYNNNYSKYLFAHEYTGFAEGAVVYARAYVELADGTIVYGSVRTVTATLSND